MRWSATHPHRPFRGAIAAARCGARGLPAAPAPPAARASADPVTHHDRRARPRAARSTPSSSPRYLASYSAARRTLRAPVGQRRAELGYVLDTLRSLARQKRLTARLRPMFLILDRNREWWAKAGPPGSGARLTFGGSRVIFQYFPGQGPADPSAGQLRAS